MRSCSIRCVAREMPSSSRERFFASASGVFARFASCAWSLIAVSGVRSSCAASEAKRRCDSRLAERRSMRLLIAFTSPRSSAGSPSVLIGFRDSGERLATLRAVRSSGARPCPTISHTMIAVSGRRMRSGCRISSDADAARLTRTDSGCPTSMISEPAVVVKTRQAAPSY